MLEVGANSKVFKLIILDEIIADAFFVLQPSLDAAAISIEFAPENSFDNSHDDWSIAGNRGQISQVFINLFQNSVKFSPRNSKIFVGIVNVLDKNGARFVRVSVSDQGMDELIQERRLPVLENAVETIINAPLHELREIAEEMGGEIASYTLEKEGAELIDFSKWLADTPNLTEEEIVSKRNTIVLRLKMVLVKIELGLSNNVD